MFANYIQEYFKLNDEDYLIIPDYWMPTQFYTVTFEGWKNITLTVDDEAFNSALEMASKTIYLIIDKYKETHAFTQPQFGVKTDGVFFIKIATMEKEMYVKLKENANGTNRE